MHCKASLSSPVLTCRMQQGVPLKPKSSCLCAPSIRFQVHSAARDVSVRTATVTERGAAECSSLERQPQAVPKLLGSTVVITGGSQGVGRATAQLFAKNGYNVVIAARNPEKLAAAHAEISRVSPSGSSMALSTDITDEAAVQQLVEAVTTKYETVNVLINCAGVCMTGALADTTVSDFVAQMNVNFMGAVTMTKGFQAALEKAAKQPGGKPVVVNVNSFGGRIPLRSMSAYSASKFALAGFTDCIRPEFADLGIHVAQVHPGVIASNFMERAGFRGVKAEQRRAAMERTLASPPPGGLVQTPEQVAQEVYNAAVQHKDEVFVGAAYNAINALYRSTGVNPFAVDAELPG